MSFRTDPLRRYRSRVRASRFAGLDPAVLSSIRNVCNLGKTSQMSCGREIKNVSMCTLALSARVSGGGGSRTRTNTRTRVLVQRFNRLPVYAEKPKMSGYKFVFLFLKKKKFSSANMFQI